MKKNAVFLDRDGVLNKLVKRDGLLTSPRNLNELVLINNLNKIKSYSFNKSYELVVITNQPDISRKFIKTNDLILIHNYIGEITGIKHFYFCPHEAKSFCSCRKPQPGLISQAAQELNLDLQKSFIVGDQKSDMLAGKKLGLIGIFVTNNNYETD